MEDVLPEAATDEVVLDMCREMAVRASAADSSLLIFEAKERRPLPEVTVAVEPADAVDMAWEDLPAPDACLLASAMTQQGSHTLARRTAGCGHGTEY
eukprot:m.194911 g.194911  ORF g.194911 m.194911 type:complete len:97 (-) comp18304_c1_seq4:15-305(-)